MNVREWAVLTQANSPDVFQAGIQLKPRQGIGSASIRSYAEHIGSEWYKADLPLSAKNVRLSESGDLIGRRS